MWPCTIITLESHALDGGDWAAARLGRLTPCNERGWAPEPVWTLWSREKYLAPAGIRASDSAAHVIVAILTELSRLFFFVARFISTFNFILLADADRLLKNQTRDIAVDL